MVIQRWQTVLLLLAVALMCVFCFTPFATVPAPDMLAAGATDIFVKDAPAFMVLNITVTVLLFAAIFMYKNLRRQMKVTMFSIALVAASIVSGCLVLYVGMPDATPVFTGGLPLLVAVLVLALLAYRFMGRDRKLLSSYDRLR